LEWLHPLLLVDLLQYQLGLSASGDR
jgi:hypothetical protein